MRGRSPARLAVLAAVAGGATLAGCSQGFGMPEARSEQGDRLLDLWSPAVVAALVVGSIVWALIIWSVIAYRRRTDSLPPQVEEHIPIEVVYTTIPILIVIVLFAFGTLAQRDVTEADPAPDVTVQVVGFQWSWQLTYEDLDVVVSGDGVGTEGPELVLPVGQTTRLVLRSEDVAHSFWVPDFLTKRDLIPGVDNEIDVTPTEEGSYIGRCAEFCGLDHWRMYFQVRVVSAEEFDRWVAETAGDDGDEAAGAGEEGGS